MKHPCQSDCAIGPCRHIPDFRRALVDGAPLACGLVKISTTATRDRAAITCAAAELRLNKRRIYDLLVRYRADPTVTALLPRTAVSRAGSCRNKSRRSS
ncbi:hypothetical protein REMIM1_PC00019 (plasmid) [Rhizobium etli bv. mimosae str. Mim1]|nr:hypothetical protein REMIM1_PC00019 [Rhizobium etli bv. mimosae str. Mim1]